MWLKPLLAFHIHERYAHMSAPPHSTDTIFPEWDDLSVLVAEVEAAIWDEHFDDAARLLEVNIAALWFGLRPARMAGVLEIILENLPSPPRLLIAGYRILRASRAERAESRKSLSDIDSEDPQQMFILAMFRMHDLRIQGRVVEALAQAATIEELLGKMRFVLDPHGGWRLQASLEIGISAMLAGDFTKALTIFTQAQLHPTTPKYSYLTRAVLVKSALIHACFGNVTSAKAFLERTKRVERTSSWLEEQIDTQLEFVRILTLSGSSEIALDRLEAVSLHDIGEMWPFYIVAIHRVFESAGHYSELEHRLEMFDALPFPRVNGVGFSGSVIPLKRAKLALRLGKGSEAVEFLGRADPKLMYTKLIQAAAQLYAGRYKQALQQAASLRHQTRGFRLVEIRRLSIIATAQFQAGDTKDSIATLEHASLLPRGLSSNEVGLFNPMIRDFAEQHVGTWPLPAEGASTFLVGLAEPGPPLTEREIEILGHLARGHTRAHIAGTLSISLNTVKTQLRSIFYKLKVSSAADAVQQGQRRGII